MADSTRSDAPLCAYDWCSRPVGPKRAHAPWCASCYSRRNWRKRKGLDPDVRPTEYKPSGKYVDRDRRKSHFVWPAWCLECEIPLPGGDKPRLTCGQRCNDARKMKRRPTGVCAQCGNTFPLRRGTTRTKQLCSYECLYASRRTGRRPARTESPIGYVSCMLCRSLHVTRAGTNRRKQRCCRDRCPCGSPRYEKGQSHLCWPCHYERYRDRFTSAAHKRRARALTNGPVEDISRLALAERDGWRCHLCRKKVRPSRRKRDPLGPSIDHLLPIHLGGTHTWDNVALAHERCNLSKGVRAVGEQLRLVG